MASQRLNGITVPGNPGQRVHNVFHHLNDCSLPLEHWDEEAELAAIIHLLMACPVWEAADAYATALQRYLDWQRNFHATVPSFSADVARARVLRVYEQLSLLPGESCAATLYVRLLKSGFATRMAHPSNSLKPAHMCYI